ncbi:MAG: 30S ribosome-binding factor RbfA [Puniceicoccales bacterium]|jgi:ribosome-binding factor A|nr:30S ribosome-binding factor RbfA [Puniceicoccales bacterium]
MGNRNLRLGEVLRRELSTLVHARHREEAALFTVTRVEVDGDGCHARVFFSAPDAGQVERCQRFLERHGGEWRRILAGRIALRRFPELHFRYDRGLVGELRVRVLLEELQTAEGGAGHVRG